MHPQLTDQKSVACREFIAAIEKCHAQGWLARLTGKCNAQKYALNECLRQERLDRTANNHKMAKERKAKRDERLQEVRELKETDSLQSV